MNYAAIASIALVGTALAGCESLPQLPSERIGEATLTLANGQPAGTAQLYRSGSEMNVTIGLVGLTPGVHGVHLHMVGSCVAPGFTSAGGHLNPTGHQHGSENPQGAHLGDLPNVTIGASGAGTVSATLKGESAAVSSAIFDGDGTAVVVHAKADDYRTDPSGDSGDRLACGVVRPVTVIRTN
ncbi:superoxide dismutase family protein [Tsuneonella sp. HG222]